MAASAATDFCIRTGWNILGNGIDGPGMITLDRSGTYYTLVEMETNERLAREGLWIFYARIDAKIQSAVGAFAESVRSNTSGRSDDSRALRQMEALAKDFAEGANLVVVPKNELPQILQARNIVVLADKYAAEHLKHWSPR